ncbi:MAG: hypothetical protein FH748_01035 [Balneolaceae bacterium]|nr:hypothetical protein [Balneolaceae bacterium]
MKVGIVGNAERGVAWEKHLRPHRIVQEVDLCHRLQDIGAVDACLILDDSDQNLGVLLQGIRRGLNCFLISDQPTNTSQLETIHRAGKEAGVHIQFSHWPTLAPASQWMMDEMNRPNVLSINKEINHSQLIDPKKEFKHFWMDELGLCMKWINSGIHHIEAKEITIENKLPLIIHLFLRFDNGASVDIRVYTGAVENQHRRIATTKQKVLECDVPSQEVRLGRLNSGGHLYYEKHEFDPSKAAEKAALMFLKSIQMNRETPYTSYNAHQLSLYTERVEQRLKQFS